MLQNDSMSSFSLPAALTEAQLIQQVDLLQAPTPALRQAAAHDLWQRTLRPHLLAPLTAAAAANITIRGNGDDCLRDGNDPDKKLTEETDHLLQQGLALLLKTESVDFDWLLKEALQFILDITQEMVKIMGIMDDDAFHDVASPRAQKRAMATASSKVAWQLESITVQRVRWMLDMIPVVAADGAERCVEVSCALPAFFQHSLTLSGGSGSSSRRNSGGWRLWRRLHRHLLHCLHRLSTHSAEVGEEAWTMARRLAELDNHTGNDSDDDDDMDDWLLPCMLQLVDSRREAQQFWYAWRRRWNERTPRCRDYFLVMQHVLPALRRPDRDGQLLSEALLATLLALNDEVEGIAVDNDECPDFWALDLVLLLPLVQYEEHVSKVQQVLDQQLLSSPQVADVMDSGDDASMVGHSLSSMLDIVVGRKVEVTRTIESAAASNDVDSHEIKLSTAVDSNGTLSALTRISIVLLLGPLRTHVNDAALESVNDFTIELCRRLDALPQRSHAEHLIQSLWQLTIQLDAAMTDEYNVTGKRKATPGDKGMDNSAEQRKASSRIQRVVYRILISLARSKPARMQYVKDQVYRTFVDGPVAGRETGDLDIIALRLDLVLATHDAAGLAPQVFSMLQISNTEHCVHRIAQAILLAARLLQSPRVSDMDKANVRAEVQRVLLPPTRRAIGAQVGCAVLVYLQAVSDQGLKFHLLQSVLSNSALVQRVTSSKTIPTMPRILASLGEQGGTGAQDLNYCIVQFERLANPSKVGNAAHVIATTQWAHGLVDMYLQCGRERTAQKWNATKWLSGVFEVPPLKVDIQNCEKRLVAALDTFSMSPWQTTASDLLQEETSLILQGALKRPGACSVFRSLIEILSQHAMCRLLAASVCSAALKNAYGYFHDTKTQLGTHDRSLIRSSVADLYTCIRHVRAVVNAIGITSVLCRTFKRKKESEKRQSDWTLVEVQCNELGQAYATSISWVVQTFAKQGKILIDSVSDTSATKEIDEVVNTLCDHGTAPEDALAKLALRSAVISSLGQVSVESALSTDSTQHSVNDLLSWWCDRITFLVSSLPKMTKLRRTNHGKLAYHGVKQLAVSYLEVFLHSVNDGIVKQRDKSFYSKEVLRLLPESQEMHVNNLLLEIGTACCGDISELSQVFAASQQLIYTVCLNDDIAHAKSLPIAWSSSKLRKGSTQADLITFEKFAWSMARGKRVNKDVANWRFALVRHVFLINGETQKVFPCASALLANLCVEFERFVDEIKRNPSTLRRVQPKTFIPVLGPSTAATVYETLLLVVYGSILTWTPGLNETSEKAMGPAGPYAPFIRRTRLLTRLLSIAYRSPAFLPRNTHAFVRRILPAVFQIVSKTTKSCAAWQESLPVRPSGRSTGALDYGDLKYLQELLSYIYQEFDNLRNANGMSCVLDKIVVSYRRRIQELANANNLKLIGSSSEPVDAWLEAQGHHSTGNNAISVCESGFTVTGGPAHCSLAGADAFEEVLSDEGSAAFGVEGDWERVPGDM